MNARNTQPVAVAYVVQAVLAACVTVGWINLDDATLAAVGTVVAALVGAVVTWRARQAVTPLARPRDADGTPLVPIDADSRLTVAAITARLAAEK